MKILLILLIWTILSCAWVISQLGRKDKKPTWWQLILDYLSTPALGVAYIFGWVALLIKWLTQDKNN